jgi:hypothetical protein
LFIAALHGLRILIEHDYFYAVMNRCISVEHSAYLLFPIFLKQTNPESGGPREPWHDWHCKIEGPAAYDVLTNFEQRWNKVAKSRDDYQLLNIDRREHLLSPSNRAPISGDPLLFVTKEYDADTWQVQVGLSTHHYFKTSLICSICCTQ